MIPIAKKLEKKKKKKKKVFSPDWSVLSEPENKRLKTFFFGIS